jgi:multidrug efflux pump
MLFWPGVIGEFMSYMPLTLIVTLLCSLFVAIVINPVLTGMFVRLESDSKPGRTALYRRVFTGIIVFVAILLGLANWRTLLVLSLGIPFLILTHRYFFKPVGDWFMASGLPSVIRRYRSMLSWMLDRDYSANHSLLRNAFALGAFTLGIVMLVLSSIVNSVAGNTASLLLLVPGGLMLVLGILGIFLHALETIFLGELSSVRAGIVFSVISLLTLGLMSLGDTAVDLNTTLNLLILPGIIIAVGLAGRIIRHRDTLILTDNRAKLLTGSIGALFAIIIMFAIDPTGVEFFPTTDPTMIQINTTGPVGMNIDASNETAQEAKELLYDLLETSPATEANVKNILVNVGVGSDQDFIGTPSPERSRISLNVVDYADRSESSQETLTRIRNFVRGIVGAEVRVKGVGDQGPPTGAPVNIEVAGPYFSEITRITRQIKQILVEASEDGSVPGLVDVSDNLNTGRPELGVHVDRVRAAQFGLTTRKIASTVRTAINGVDAGKYRDGDDEYDIVVRLRKTDRESLESLNNLTILEEGIQIPLVSVADLRVAGGLGSITRLDMERVAIVTGQAAPGANGQAILSKVQTLLKDVEASLPSEYHISYTGENEEQAESFGFLSVVFLIGVSLIFMIMVAQFNKVSSPFIIMVAVGFSLIGVLLGLILTRTPFGLMTFIGVISLAGIVVNNNIVLIDYTMQLQDRGMMKHDAIIEAGATRLRPVLLTALTTIIGLIPLTFGINIDFVGLLTRLDPNFQFGSENTQFWGPMGTAIIAGLSFATFLTLVIVPVMYSVFDSIARRMGSVLRDASIETTSS